jgi:hypothetical protein
VITSLYGAVTILAFVCLDWKIDNKGALLPFARLCGLVVRVPGCRPRGPGFDSRHYQILLEAVCLERGPLILVRINEELLERKVAVSV